MTSIQDTVGAVVIGRNEGVTLLKGLTSLQEQLSHIVYVDSGSTDGSVFKARKMGLSVIELDLSVPFTAARARNAGWAKLRQIPSLRYVQFLDGDCELQPRWLQVAVAFLEERPGVSVVCGRRRERFPQASVYNRLIDLEWDTPIGEARACGGDSLMRLDALDAVGGFRDTMIAGEEPELCVRLRQMGGRIWRLEKEMTLHDAAIKRLGQWWRRARRAGHAYAEGAALHGAPPEMHNVAALSRCLLWGASIPLIALAMMPVIGLSAVLIFLMWPAQILRLWRRSGDFTQAFFLTLGKVPEALGAIEFYASRLFGQRKRIIEYK